MKLAFATDLHLNKANHSRSKAFYQKLTGDHPDAVVIAGDISEARMLPFHLSEIARVCAPKPVYFVLGNHDFYGSSFVAMDRAVTECCHRHGNLQHLGQGEVIRLSPNVGLIGHRGWADGRAYGGKWTSQRNPDREGIRELRGHSTFDTLRKMKMLGLDSGRYFRTILPYALTAYQHVVIVTHVPPFAQAVRFNGRPCDAELLPHYANVSAGGVILRIGEHFPRAKITVLCGHSHHGHTVRVADNIEVRVGRARNGHPAIQGALEL